MGQLPYILYSYVSMYDAKTIESIMITMNSVNKCGYCTGLHGELARLSGIPSAETNRLLACTSYSEALKVRDTPAVRFAYDFARHDGKNIPKLLKDAKVSDAEKSRVVALCYFLYWGSFGGNTINSFVFCKRLSLFGMFFTMYYGALYLLILLTSALLKVFPSNVPGIVSSMLGVVLTICAGTFILPLGLIAKVLQY